MASFDVISLFTNIPLDFAVNLVLQNFCSDSGVTLFPALNKPQFKKLLIWTTKNITWTFTDQYCKQIYRVAMGFLLAPLLGDMCMN